MQINFREYQKLDIAYMTERKRVINANDPGLGKTLETLTARKNIGAKSTLIIAPKIATGVWKQEAQQWYKWDSTILTGTPKQRLDIWNNLNTDILITNFAHTKEVLQVKPIWDLIIIDEAHLGGLLNHKTQTYKTVEKLQSQSIYILTGTPIRRGPQDMYPLLHLVNPNKFKSYWQFINRYCIQIDTGFGKDIAGRPKDPIAFNNMLKVYMVRNLKTKVLHELPDKIKSAQPVIMTKKQEKSYRYLAKNMMLETPTEFYMCQNEMTLMLRLRQLLICPMLLGVDDYGASLLALVHDLIPIEFDHGRSVVICTPFRKAIPFIIDAINDFLPDVYIEQIHGGVKEPSNDVAIRFQSMETHRKILIYTIKSGASWTATDASTAFFLGAEWNNTDNIQAEDRIHRIGQKNVVEIKYLINENTVDEEVRSRLNTKNLSSNWVLNPREVFQKLESIKALTYFSN